ncbi:MAG: DUF1127 domain-containing protein [Candidatus Symbiobacter sp.]|nr:DUF1127 domain-containing protein [Candidatus Symbiobacter sp.]
MRTASLTNVNNTLIGEKFVADQSGSSKGWFGRLYNSFNTEYHRVSAYRSLSRFSDRELADIGLARHEIRDAVWGNSAK